MTEPLVNRKSYIMGVLVMPVLGWLISQGYIDGEIAKGLEWIVGGVVVVVMRLAIGRRRP